MKPLFPRWTNTLFRVVLGSLVLLPTAALTLGMLWVRSPMRTMQDQPVAQPVQFDHRHHVADLGIDCRYCHQSVEKAASAGIPPAQLCMNCHSQVWNKSDKLAVVREAYYNGTPVPWARVHRLPDFVYFNHSIHVNKGVGCATCHGRIDHMAEVAQAQPLTMQFCLECHRNPEPELRPKEFITDMTWEHPAGQTAQAFGAKIADEYHVHARQSCSTCHR